MKRNSLAYSESIHTCLNQTFNEIGLSEINLNINSELITASIDEINLEEIDAISKNKADKNNIVYFSKIEINFINQLYLSLLSDPGEKQWAAVRINNRSAGELITNKSSKADVSTALFTVSGAHGVGKSTAMIELKKIMDCAPFDFYHFHHMYNKGKGKIQNSIKTKKKSNNKLLVFMWHKLMPGLIKRIIVSALDEITYINNINRIIGNKNGNERIIFIDRYAYDRYIDLKLRDAPRTQVNMVRIVCAMLKKPRLSIILTDTPENIFKRKQELKPEMIDAYQIEIVSLCEKIKTAYLSIQINERKPDVIARLIVKNSLRSLNNDIFSYIKY